MFFLAWKLRQLKALLLGLGSSIIRINTSSTKQLALQKPFKILHYLVSTICCKERVYIYMKSLQCVVCWKLLSDSALWPVAGVFFFLRVFYFFPPSCFDRWQDAALILYHNNNQLLPLNWFQASSGYSSQQQWFQGRFVCHLKRLKEFFFNFEQKTRSHEFCDKWTKILLQGTQLGWYTPIILPCMYVYRTCVSALHVYIHYKMKGRGPRSEALLVFGWNYRHNHN